MNLWNTKNLPGPPINTYKTTNKNIDIKHLYNVFTEGKKFFEDGNYLHAEYAVLSRIVYRMKQKFRSAKDFKAVEKVYKALDNYFKTGLLTNLQNFMDLIPLRYKDETYLPTKNLLDYILVRLQGLAKLMERIVETCKISAYLLDKRIHIGHFWKIAFILFSLVSRVYVLAKYTAKFICAFYNKLLPFSSQLGNTSGNWLPEEYLLPNDLKEWMSVKWLEVDDEVQIIDVQKDLPDIMQFFDLVDDDDDVVFCNEYVMVDDDVDEDNVEVNDFMGRRTNLKDKYLEYLGVLRGFDTREDVGEIIEVNDSLLMPDEESSVQILDNIFADSLTVSDTSVLEISDIQVHKNKKRKTKTVITNQDKKRNILADYNLKSVMPDEDSSVQILDNTIEEVGHVIGINDSLLMPNEDSSVQILDNTFADSLTISDTSVLEISDIQVQTKKRKNRKVTKKQDKKRNILVDSNKKSIMPDEDSSVLNNKFAHSLSIPDYYSLQVFDDTINGNCDIRQSNSTVKNNSSKSNNVNTNINRDVSDATILTKQTDNVENSVIEIEDENDKINSNNYTFIFDTRREEESIITASDTSVLEIPDTQVQKKKKRKSKKLIKNQDKKRNILVDCNPERVINISEVNKNSTIVLSNTAGTIDGKVRKRKNKTKKNGVNKTMNKFGRSGKKGDSFTNKLFKDIRNDVDEIKRIVDLSNNNVSNKELKNDEISNSKSNLHRLNDKKFDNKLKLNNKSQINSPSVVPSSVPLTSVNNARKRRLDNEAVLFNDIKKKEANIMNITKKIKMHTKKFTENGQSNSQETSGQWSEPSSNRDTKIKIKNLFNVKHNNRSNTTKFKKERREKSVPSPKKTDISFASHKRTDMSHQSTSYTNTSIDASKTKKKKQKKLQMKKRQGDTKSSLTFSPNLYKEKITNPKHSKRQLKKKKRNE